MTTPDSPWSQRAAQLDIAGEAFIDGRWEAAANNATFPAVSPIDGRILTQVARCGRPEVDRAVSAARRAFESGCWSGLEPRARKAVMLKWAECLLAHKDELALLETLDTGKPIGDTATIDVPSAAYCIAWFAEAIDKTGGEIAPTAAHLLGLVERVPVGVVAAIVPWNFPLLLAVWKCAPAIACGNSVVLKPSEKSSLSALRIAELALEAGLPAGVLNVVPGFGEVGEALASHLDVDCVAFTGSTAVGRKIAHYAADSNLKRVWLELGGKSPQVVLPDVPDIDAAADAIARAVFYNTGQMCTAGSRLLVHRDIKHALLDRVVAAAHAWLPSDPLSAATRMGSVIDSPHLERVLGFVERGRETAKLVAGGRQMNATSGGAYIEPTIFDCPSPDIELVREEIFGPVLSVLTFDSLDEAISLANDSPYGLAASVWTSNLGTAHLTARRLRAGTVWVNCYEETDDMNFPFGGFRESGNGRDNSLHALEKYSELRSTILKLS